MLFNHVWITLPITTIVNFLFIGCAWYQHNFSSSFSSKSIKISSHFYHNVIKDNQYEGESMVKYTQKVM
jgi:hypothetical protein